MDRHSQWWALGSCLTNVLDAPFGLILMVLVCICYCNYMEMRFGTMEGGVGSNSTSLLGATDRNLGGWEVHYATRKPGNGKAQ